MAIARLLAGADGSVAPGPRDRDEDDEPLVGDRALVRTATAVEGHPDNVGPAIHGGLVVAATGDDGDLVVRVAPPPSRLDVAVLLPDRTSSTAVARGVVRDELPRADVITQVARAGHVVGALLGAWPADARVVGDRLHEPPRAAALGAGGELLSRLRSAGHHAWLSGAGPSVAVAVPSRDEALPITLVDAARDAGHTLLRLRWDRQGVRSCVPDGCGVSGTGTCLDCPLGSLR
jgi:homoserine kinase